MSTAADGLVRRPGPGDLAGAAFRLARSHYRCLLAAAAVALAPCLALGGWALDSYRSGASRASSSTELLAVLGALVIALGGLLAVGTGVHAAVSAAVGGVADWRESVRVAAARVGPLFSGACAIVILGFLGLVCFVAPGIYLWFAWFVAMPAIVIERRGGWDALRRSRRLVRGRWWTVFGAFVLVEAAVLVISLVVGLIVGALFASSGAANATASQVVAYCLELLLSPVQIALVAVVYLYLRATVEGANAASVAREGGIELLAELGGATRVAPREESAAWPGVPEVADGGEASDVQPPETPAEVEPARARGGEAGATDGRGGARRGWPAPSPKPPPPRRRQGGEPN
ncbi:MAG TPA: glycerophosphoryl diester phosphodiesterase membrane domain-containing protein [Acidimicrobiales bacterium]|nr:glycerophosphoryl diester phosphodiesterase membrane domain-containing protein [Acidimicrobiales bacterium]